MFKLTEEEIKLILEWYEFYIMFENPSVEETNLVKSLKEFILKFKDLTK